MVPGADMATLLAFVVILLAQDEPAQYPPPVICLYNSPQQFRLGQGRQDALPLPIMPAGPTRSPRVYCDP